ncbi:hypothetical protein RSOLAG1IB_08855 [Rhizoctonia solani AG-1 IB]|uniref:Transmembrane protein n=1 Tax=Thanatephorus cucumeris (strain AG1-IB / isolate 7/3/14) TaxID=1108050 RepID=A0A0B7FLI4_THACB|nr:hypothetical protein RSOLAG1IB_08855 [Rhizoctonia solani AG-1 IB]
MLTHAVRYAGTAVEGDCAAELAHFVTLVDVARQTKLAVITKDAVIRALSAAQEEDAAKAGATVLLLMESPGVVRTDKHALVSLNVPARVIPAVRMRTFAAVRHFTQLCIWRRPENPLVASVVSERKHKYVHGIGTAFAFCGYLEFGYPAIIHAIIPAIIKYVNYNYDYRANNDSGFTQQVTSTLSLTEVSTTRVVVTQTSVATQTDHSSVEVAPSPHSSTRSVAGTSLTGTSLTAQTSETGAVLVPQPQSATNVGAIAGGTVAGLVALVVLLIFLIVWRRKQSSSNEEVQVPQAVYEPGSGSLYNHAYSPGAVPPTPATGDPFLTPMSQHKNVGVSYFGSNATGSLSGSNSIPRYTGLPEPQNGESTGSAIAAYSLPVPRHDIHQPRPLPMSVTPMRENATDARSWSGFGSRPSDEQNTAYSGGVDTSYQSPRGWSSYEIPNTNSAYLPDGAAPPTTNFAGTENPLH